MPTLVAVSEPVTAMGGEALELTTTPHCVAWIEPPVTVRAGYPWEGLSPIPARYAGGGAGVGGDGAGEDGDGGVAEEGEEDGGLGLGDGDFDVAVRGADRTDIVAGGPGGWVVYGDMDAVEAVGKAVGSAGGARGEDDVAEVDEAAGAGGVEVESAGDGGGVGGGLHGALVFEEGADVGGDADEADEDGQREGYEEDGLAALVAMDSHEAAP